MNKELLEAIVQNLFPHWTKQYKEHAKSCRMCQDSIGLIKQLMEE